MTVSLPKSVLLFHWDQGAISDRILGHSPMSVTTALAPPSHTRSSLLTITPSLSQTDLQYMMHVIRHASRLFQVWSCHGCLRFKFSGVLLEVLEDEASGGVGLEEGCKDQRFHSHEFDENIERGTRGILERVSDCISDDSRHVRGRPLSSQGAGMVRRTSLYKFLMDQRSLSNNKQWF